MRKSIIVGGALAGAAALVLTVSPSGAAAYHRPTVKHKVVLEIDGTFKGARTISYVVNRDSVDLKRVRLPWFEYTQNYRSRVDVDLKAQGSGYGRINCKIKINGSVVSRSTSSGNNPTVHCWAWAS